MLIFKNCNAFLGKEELFEKTNIYIENHKFSRIDEVLEIENGDEIIDLEGYYVTPGLVEPHCHIGLLEHGVGWAGSDENENHEPVQDQCRAVDGINMHDRSFQDFRENGITSVGVFPGNTCVVGGYGAAIKCKGNVIDEAVIKTDVGLKVALGGVVKDHFVPMKKAPITRMGIMGLLNQFMIDSKADAKHKEILSGDLPIVINCERLDDIHTAIRFKEAYNINVKLVGLSDFEDAKDLLAKKNIEFALGPVMGYATMKETCNRDRYRPIDAATMGQGALTTCHPTVNGRYTMLQASIMVQNGLEDACAFEALSINGAKFLGIEDTVGSIDLGKDADLVIWDGYPLEFSSKVIATIIDGEFVYKGGEF